MADTRQTEDQADKEPLVKILIADKKARQVEAMAIIRDDLDRNQISHACVTDLGFSGESPPLFLRWRFPAPPDTSVFPALKEEFVIVDNIEPGHPEVLLKASADQYMGSARRGSLPIVRLAKNKQEKSDNKRKADDNELRCQKEREQARETKKARYTHEKESQKGESASKERKS